MYIGQEIQNQNSNQQYHAMQSSGQNNMYFQQQQNQQNIVQQQQINNDMVVPGMPLNQGFTEEQQLYSLQGGQRLKQLKQIYVQATQANRCGDIIFCNYAPTQIEVKMRRHDANSFFIVKFDDTKQKMQTKLKGEFIATNIRGEQEQKLYDVSHKRTCFKFKCPFLIVHPIGMLTWAILNKTNPPKSKLKRNGQTLYQYVYSCCARDAKIMDSEGNLKYKIDNPGNCFNLTRVLRNGNSGENIEGFYMDTVYGGHKNNQRIGAAITFPNDMSEDDRAAIIYAMMRMN